MAESFFRQGILKKAWETTWSHKSLWFFGLFAAILSFGEEYDVLIRNSDILDAVPRRFEQVKTLTEQGIASGVWQNVVTVFQTNFGGTLTILLTWIISILAVAWLVIVSQSALIEGARRHGEQRSLPLLDGFDVGMANFWPIFLVNVIAKVFLYGLLLIVVVPLLLIFIQTGNNGLVVVAMLWTFFVLVPMITMVSFIQKLASAYVVIKKYPVRQAIAAAWGLFTKYWLVIIELALILIFINAATVIVAVSTLITQLKFPEVTTFGYLIFIVVLGFIFAWLTTFQFSAWTNLFLRLEEGNAPSKLRRILHYILDIRPKPTVAVRPARR